MVSLAVALAVAGTLLVALSYPDLGGRVVVHERVVFDNEYEWVGPYDLEEGTYVIWISEDADGVAAEAHSDEGASARTEINPTHTHTTIDWVPCMAIEEFPELPDGSWTFVVGVILDEDEAQTYDVFITRDVGYGPLAMSIAGVVCLVLVAIVAGVLFHRGRGRSDL